MTRPATLLIRPDQHADPVELALRDHGASVYKFAVIEIQAETIDPQLLGDWCNTQWDSLIAVSPNAVRSLTKALAQGGQKFAWPRAKTCYAVGSGTAEVLAEASGQPVHYPAHDFTSEGLLHLPELGDCSSQKCLLLTGIDGRSLLADSLRERGADLTIAEVYRRLPQINSLGNEEPAWRENVQTIIVSSVEQATLFWDHLSSAGRSWATACHWVVPRGRVAHFIEQQGILAERLHIAQNASPTSLIQAWKTIGITAMTETPNEQSKQPVENAAAGQRSSTQLKKTGKSKAKLGWFTRFFLLLIALSLGVLAFGGYYVWQQQQIMRADTQARLDAMHERIINREQSGSEVRDWSEDIATLQSNMMQQLELERRARERGFERLDTLRLDTQENLQQALDEYSRLTHRLANEVRINSARHGEYRHLFEAFDLVSLAQHRLSLEFDIAGAIRLLELAKQRLETQAAGRYQTIIRQLANDIEMLRELPVIDVGAIALELQQLQAGVRTLAFNAEISQMENTSSQHAVTGDLRDWRQNLAQAWENFSSDLIQVRRHDAPPLRLDHEQRTFILGQIEMALQIAKQAALRHHQDLYRHTLLDTLNIIERYLNIEDTGVQQFQTSLSMLSELSIEPDYPTRLLSHAMLRVRVDEIGHQQEE